MAEPSRTRRRGPQPGTPRGPRMRREDREQQLLEVAERTFGEQGYTETTMEEIALRAGITKPVIYDHFRSKELLLVKVVARARADLVEAVRSALESAGPRASIEDRLRAGFVAFFDFFEGRREGFRAYLQESAIVDNAGAEFAGARDDQAHLIAASIAALAAPGHFPEHVLHGMAGMIVAAVENVAAWRLRHPEVTSQEAADLVMAVFWPGLEALARETRLEHQG